MEDNLKSKTMSLFEEVEEKRGCTHTPYGSDLCSCKGWSESLLSYIHTNQPFCTTIIIIKYKAKSHAGLE